MIETTRYPDGGLAISLTEPRLDAVNAPAFKDAATALLSGGDNRVILDLARVDFVDSSGIGALVGLLKRIGTRGDLAITGLRPAVERAFKLTRMDRVFAIFPDVAAARQKLGL